MKNKILGLLLLLVGGCSASATAGSFADAVGTHYAASWSTAVRTPRDVSATINSNLSYADNYAAFAASTVNLTKYGTTVLQAFGGREAENVARFLDAIQADHGVGYREHMLAKALLTPENAYWQIGNEINNGQKLSPSIHAWLGDGLPGSSNDLSIIPTYAEMWFAPAASGLRAGGAKIVLGSVANAANAKALEFIAALLDYQLAGTYAPDLAGMRVRDLVDVGSIHYSQGASNWQEPIAAFGDKPVWHTEEVGGGPAEKGLCMTAAVKAIGRTFSGNPSGKVFLWGAWAGANSCDQWMPIIATFTGEYQLSLTPNLIVEGSTDLEVYAYDVGSTNKKVVFVVGVGTLTGVTGSGTVYVFRATGVEQLPASQYMNIPLDANTSIFISLE